MAIGDIASHHTSFQKKVLLWDYPQLREHYKSDKKRKKGPGPELPTVPEVFGSVQEYYSVFEPLLLEECRAQIVREEDDSEKKLEFHMAALTSHEKINEFHSAKFAVSEEVIERFKDNDLVYLMKQGDVDVSALAIVEGRQSLQISLRFYFGGNESPGRTLFLNKRLKKVQAALGDLKRAAWSLSKLSSLSTISREYVGLHSLDYSSLRSIILSAQFSPSLSPQIRTLPRQLKEYLEGTYNESQLEAIQAGLSGKPLILIQGPPGTGKTKTILGLLSVVLHATAATFSKDDSLRAQENLEMSTHQKKENWIKASPWLQGQNPRDLIMPQDGDDGFFPLAANQFRTETLGAVARKHRAHVLVCAPSNSALDEIVLRILKSGIQDENGESYAPSVVRMGLNAHHSIQSVCMDNLVEQRLKSIDRSMTTGPRGASGREERERIQLAILEEAAIVCSTLSFSGSKDFARMRRSFDAVIIDEAAQAVEPATLIPLSYGCKQAFLVGDPKQLPATVLSDDAVKHGYLTSMFERFQKAGYPVQMLKTQYRMHPQIREFPSSEFYQGSLEDGPQMAQTTARDWHEYICFGPFAFFDVEGRDSRPGAGSYENIDEVDFVLVLYRHLIAWYPQLKGGPNFAVISPYRQQVKALRDRFEDVLGKDAARLVDINTVDGFQGREKDIAIFSCVRSDKEKSIGFVANERRINVGLTRAKASMLVVGCAAALQQDEHWNNLIVHAQERGRLFKAQKPYHALFNEASLMKMKYVPEQQLQQQQQQQAQQQQQQQQQPQLQGVELLEEAQQVDTTADGANQQDDDAVEEYEDFDEGFD